MNRDVVYVVVRVMVQDETGATIDVDRDTGTVSIRAASAEAVEKCKALVEKLIESSGPAAGSGAAAGAVDGDSIERRVKIDKSSIGAVIGSGATVIRLR